MVDVSGMQVEPTMHGLNTHLAAVTAAQEHVVDPCPIRTEIREGGDQLAAQNVDRLLTTKKIC